MQPTTESGGLDILNVGLGDLKVRWNPLDAADRAKAKKMIQDLMRQGYAILIEEPDGSYKRATRFDPDRDCYIVTEVVRGEEQSAEASETTTEESEAGSSRRAKPRGRPRTREVARPRATTRGTAVGRSAGG